MPHWHDHNPWAARIVYLTLEEWLDCLADRAPRTAAHYRALAANHKGRIDCYILPGKSHCSIGMRYSADGPDYYSPQSDEKSCREYLRKYLPINIQNELSITREFLRELAKHLEANEMPGQAGNCTIRANGLTNALHALDRLVDYK